MTHAHEPSEPIAAFCFTCKHCGEEIEAVECGKCQGTGSFIDSLGRTLSYCCRSCNGTGVDHWEVVK